VNPKLLLLLCRDRISFGDMVLGDRVEGLPRSGLWLRSIRERRVS